MEQVTETINKQILIDESNKNFELSHIIGLNTYINKPIQCHPIYSDTIIYAVGGIIISEDLNEKNNQIFFRHNNNQINCFRISNTGKYLAVGFTSGKENFDRKILTSIIIWDYGNKKILNEISEVYKAVNLLEFSQDDKFLAVAGQDNSFSIWEVSTGHKSYGRLYEFPISFMMWTQISRSSDASSTSEVNDYTITLSNMTGLFYYYFVFELRSMQYVIKNGKFTFPSTGFARNYTSGFYDDTTKTMYLGTSGGELILFNMANLYFKNSFNVINNGVSSIVFVKEDNEIIVGGGDGKVKKITRQGESTQPGGVNHSLVQEIIFPGKISSLSLTSDKKEIIVCTTIGKTFRILTSNFKYTLHSIAHTSSVNDVAYKKNKNDECYTVDDNGGAYLIELNDFNLLSEHNCSDMSANQIVEAKSISVAEDDETVFIGYSNGLLRNCSSDLEAKNFEIPTHKGSVNCLFINANYILTGGEDGIVRVWARKTHELIIQFAAHHKDVFNVFPDINKPNLIYSCGYDRNLICYDLKIQKRINNQSLKNGVISSITQNNKGDNEISKKKD